MAYDKILQIAKPTSVKKRALLLITTKEVQNNFLCISLHFYDHLYTVHWKGVTYLPFMELDHLTEEW